MSLVGGQTPLHRYTVTPLLLRVKGKHRYTVYTGDTVYTGYTSRSDRALAHEGVRTKVTLATPFTPFTPVTPFTPLTPFTPVTPFTPFTPVTPFYTVLHRYTPLYTVYIGYASYTQNVGHTDYAVTQTPSGTVTAIALTSVHAASYDQSHDTASRLLIRFMTWCWMQQRA